MMFAFADAWAFLKADDSDKARGMYREATIPFDKETTKLSRNLEERPFADRFGSLAISQALADMGKPIIPETPIRGGKTEQVQMDEVFTNLVNLTMVVSMIRPETNNIPITRKRLLIY